MATQADVLRFAQANRDIRALVTRDLEAFWRRLNLSDALAVREAVEAFLPAGFDLGPDPGYAIAHFAEWQSATADGEEALDPVRAQYGEFFLLIECAREGERTFLHARPDPASKAIRDLNMSEQTRMLWR